MPDPTQVVVTTEHIRRGQKANVASCPIALAASDAFGEPMHHAYAGIHRAHTDLVPPDAGNWTLLPVNDALSFQTDFDAGKSVKPVTFAIKAGGRPDSWPS
jgi:hypothetical protein